MSERKIYKYEVQHGKRTIGMPKDSKILCVNSQRASGFGASPDDESVFIWAEVNPSNADTERTFTLYGTGQKIESQHEVYVGTAFLADRQLVFHVYEAPHE